MPKSSTETNAQKSRAYHHGELRQALIDAAWEMINQKGVESFTIVDAAQKAGVSKAAPYRHFKDRDALLEAVVDTGFDKLTAAALGATEPYAMGSRENIRAGGVAYVRFFHSYPAFFDLMFRGSPNHIHAISDSDFGSNTEETMLRAGCLQRHIDSVHDWCRLADVPETMAVDIAIKLWATVHGMVSLSLNQNLEQVDPNADIELMLHSFTDAFLDGVEASVANGKTTN